MEPADITFGEQGVPSALTLQHLLEVIMEVISVLDTGETVQVVGFRRPGNDFRELGDIANDSDDWLGNPVADRATASLYVTISCSSTINRLTAICASRGEDS